MLSNWRRQGHLALSSSKILGDILACNAMTETAGRRAPGQTVQEVLRADAIAPPEVLLREYPPDYVDNHEISVDRYLTQRMA